MRVHVWLRCPDCRKRYDWDEDLTDLLTGFVLCPECGRGLTIANWTGRVHKDNIVLRDDIIDAAADIRLRGLGFERSFTEQLYRKEVPPGRTLYVDIRHGRLRMYGYQGGAKIRANSEHVFQDVDREVGWLWYDPYANGRSKTVEERVLAEYVAIWKRELALPEEERKRKREEVKRLSGAIQYTGNA